ncbi:MAG: hypothetical protein AAF687_02795 [Pseudomonadota bacterium]
MRHGEFGVVSMRLDTTGPDLRATLAARDPGFVPAIQAALSERAVAASQDGANASNQRGQEQSQGQSTGSNLGSNAQGSGAQSDPRYGSSLGSAQGSPSPRSGHHDDAARDSRDRDQSGALSGPKRYDGADGVFA